MPRPTLHLIDGSAQLHRAYFAIRGLATSRGMPTNAVYGFTTMLRKLLSDEKPERIGVCFDLKAPTFRHQEYAEYKANRRKMDDDLAVQIPYVRRVCEAFRLPVLELAGFEADDVIATLARQAVARGLRVVVVTGDKDLLQLVSGDVQVLNPGREGSGATLYDRATVEEKFGVPPEKVADVLALVGDAVDNVPGVPGIGDKGARDLIRQFGSLEAVLDGADQVKRASYREGLQKHREDALLSKRLVTLREDAPVDLDLEALALQAPDRTAAHALFSELEFGPLAREYAPVAVASRSEVRVVQDDAELAGVVAEARAASEVALSLVRSSREPMRARVIGVGLSWQPGRGVYVPVAHSGLEVPEPLSRPLEALRPLLEDPAVSKASARSKTDRVVLGEAGLELTGAGFDVPIAAYLLNPGRRSFLLEDIATEVLGEKPAAPLGLLEGSPEAIPLEPASLAAATEADLTLRLAGPLRARLHEDGLSGIFETMELPLCAVLAGMERAGVKINAPFLQDMSRDMEQQLDALTREIHVLAKGAFNINSPQQLREVLFERLGMRPTKKTAKTRESSTAEEVLEELALVHELPRKVLEYRSVQKLKSTYVDALPALVHPRTGRIHATFNQTVAATGRISSSDPNLQNIPIRTPEGKRIREAFVAERGHLLLSADYSQIELRVLAHLSGDPTLCDTFRRGEDVHERTAQEIFGPFAAVSVDEQRRVAKMVNYALLYGKTAFTLAKDLGVSQGQADQFIRAYFERYPLVKEFIERTVAEARETLQVRTLLGRLRRLPDLRAKNFQVRSEAERQARNTPVQGSAADLIKKAMIELDRELRSRGLASRLVLQIHDELLLEVPETEAEPARVLVKQVMEGALALDVPLVVDARLGATWAEVH